MITIKDCEQVCSLEESAIFVLNKIVYDYKRAYSTSYDRQTYWDYGIEINKTIKSLKKQINNQQFRFDPLLLIEKRIKNKNRKIYISTWKDKIVERWINNSLNILLSGWFTKHSYAYRVDGLGLDKCQHKVYRIIKNKNFYVKRDIRNYFYSIDQDLLLEKIATIVNPQDYLYNLLESRIRFSYHWGDNEFRSELGIPFGSSLACSLANIYLTDLDKKVIKFPISYFRYADDFLIAGKDPEITLQAANVLDGCIKDLRLATKPSHSKQVSFVQHPDFIKINKFKFLGLEFTKEGKVTLAVEKQRKIINFYKRILWYNRKKIKKIKDLDKRLAFVISTCNDLLNNRIRSVAIIDYYLKHINDENKLQVMDRMIAEIVISATLIKPFRKKDFRKISFKKLRKMGLISLLHRHRLHKHGHLKVNFLSIRNDLFIKRYTNSISRAKNRINQIKLARKLRVEEKHKVEMELHEKP